VFYAQYFESKPSLDIFFALPVLLSLIIVLPKFYVQNKAIQTFQAEELNFLTALKQGFFVVFMHLLVYKTVQVDFFYALGALLIIYCRYAYREALDEELKEMKAAQTAPHAIASLPSGPLCW